MKYLFINDSIEFEKNIFSFFPDCYKIYNDVLLMFTICRGEEQDQIYINRVYDTVEKIKQSILQIPLINETFDKIFITTCTFDNSVDMRTYLFQLAPLVKNPHNDLLVFRLLGHERMYNVYNEVRTWQQALNMAWRTCNFKYLYSSFPGPSLGIYTKINNKLTREECHPDFFINYLFKYFLKESVNFGIIQKYQPDSKDD